MLLLEKFKEPLIVILLVAMSMSFVVSLYQYSQGTVGFDVFLEPIGILFAVILAIGVGFLFEQNANKKFDILIQEGESQPVKVIRNGNYSSISRCDIVVGDIVLLDIGDEVPADGILLEAVSLHTNESVLTGEPVIRKTVNSQDFLHDATYPSDRVLRGTTVVDGHGTMKVTMVGDRTEYGKVYEGSQIDNKVKTPLNIQLERLSKIITWISYIIALLIIVGRLILFFTGSADFSITETGRYVLNTLMLAITVIVVAVPEGLPMSVSLSLALSMRRMLTTNNLVRKMHACETMGAATVICTDKTGTLTQNQMRVSETMFPVLGVNQDKIGGETWNIIEQSVAVNSTANLDLSENRIKTLGNPTEAALLLWLQDHNVDYRNIREKIDVVEQSAFSTEKKYMATLVATKNEYEQLLLVKGAPEILLGFCSDVLVGKDKCDALSNQREVIETTLLNYQNRAMRTLGFAYIKLERGTHCFDKDGRLRISGLTFLGVVAISDPVRKEVPEAVRSCIDAGIKVKIVTGDTPGTAKEIGRQIGLWTSEDGDENHITGAEFAAMSNEKLLQRLPSIKIMSRARPMDKSRLVTLLQQMGEVVAVTGDGTNDAPALKAAQVGLSMGDGTSVAKQASAITIMDNSFKSINRAVLWGRSLYRNIQRFILFQLTINVVACLVVLIGSFIGTELPLTVTQMLWVNLIMDTFAAMALASLPPEESVMKEKPRKTTDNIITPKMSSVIAAISVLFLVVLMSLIYIFKCNDVQSLDILWSGTLSYTLPQGGGVLSAYELSLFFTIFVMLQLWNMFNAKAYLTRRSAFCSMSKSQSFAVIVLVIILGQIIIVNFGGAMFNVVPISFADWLYIVLGTSAVLVVGEIYRLFLTISKG
jgi:Ca2+-transporting ATPase